MIDGADLCGIFGHPPSERIDFEVAGGLQRHVATRAALIYAAIFNSTFIDATIIVHEAVFHEAKFPEAKFLEAKFPEQLFALGRGMEGLARRAGRYQF